MKVRPPLKSPVRVGELLKQRLAETGRTADELADAVQIPVGYIRDLIAGRQRPPVPERTDLYERMTAFLHLSRNDLALCARAERDAAAPVRTPAPSPKIRRLLLELCEPKTAEALEQRRAKSGSAELADMCSRLLGVMQAAVRRTLDDRIGMRIAAQRGGRSHEALRLKVLQFLDATPDTLTPDDIADFVRPRLQVWDVDLDTGVLRVVLRGQEPPVGRASA